MDAARRALPHLVECAERRMTITYGELGRRIGRHARTLAPVLGYIRDEICAARGLPLLSALVVSKETGLPGPGFLAEGTNGLSPGAYRGAAKSHQQAVVNHAGWRDLLAEMGIDTGEQRDRRRWAEEVGRRGEELYRTRIQPRLHPGQEGRFLVLDVDSGDYEIDDDDVIATRRLLERRPAALHYGVRIGEESAYRIRSERANAPVR